MSTNPTAQENDCRHEKRRTPRLRILAIFLAAAGSIMLGGGVLAAWTPSSAVTSGAYGAADLGVAVADTNGTTFATGVNNLLPGDYLNRYVNLTNSGTVAQTYSGTVVGSGTLAGALSVQLDSCSVAWSSNGTCSGVTTPVKAATNTGAPVAFGFPSLVPGGVNRVRLQFKVDPSADQTTFQGTTSNMQVNIAGSTTVAGGSDRTAG